MQSDPDLKGIIMWQSGISGAGFLLFVLFSFVSLGSSSHDVKRCLFEVDTMKNHPTQHCGLQSSCYRKRDLDNCNDLNLRSETQTLGQLLPADGQHHQQVDRANSGEQLSPSISYSQCASSPSFTPLASTTDMGHNSNLAPSLSISAPEAEPASVILGKLPLNVSHLSLSSTIVHCSHVPPFRPPSFAVRSSPSFVLSTAPVLSSIHPIDDTISAVQTSPFQGESAQVHRQVLMHPYKPKQLFPKVQMDLMRPVATPKPSVPQLFLPGTSEGGLISPVPANNMHLFVSPLKSSQPTRTHPAAPYSLIHSSTPLATGRIPHVQATSSPYDSNRAGSLMPPIQNGKSPGRPHSGIFVPALPPSHVWQMIVPSSVSSHDGQPQVPSSQRFQAPDSQPSGRFARPSNSHPLPTFRPIVSNGNQPNVPSVYKIQPPKSLPSLKDPPPLSSSGPLPFIIPPSVSGSPHDRPHQMPPIAHNPAMSDPSHLFSNRPSSGLFGIPSQARPPLTYSRTSVSPAGPVSSPTTLRFEPPPGGLRTPTAAPLIIFPSHPRDRSVQGPVSPPSILPFEAPTGDRRMPAVAPSIIFPSHPYGGVVQGPVTSPPTIDISKPPQKEPRIPVAEPPRKRTRRQAPVEVLPKNQGPIAYPPNIFPSEPRWKHPRLPGIAPPGKRLQRHAPATSPPMIQGTAFSPQITFPSERPSRNSRTPALAPLTLYPSPSRHPGVTGPVTSPPTIDISKPPQKEPRIPVAEPPRKRTRRQAPVEVLPKNQGTAFSPQITFPPERPSRNSRMPALAPLTLYPSPSRPPGVTGPVTSPPTIDISKPPQKEPLIPVAEPPRKRIRRQAPVAVLPKNQGPIAHPPNIFPSEPRWKHPRLPVIAPPGKGSAAPGKRLQRHAPATSPPMIQGTAFPPQITFPPERPSRNSRTPALAPLTIYPSPSRHHGVTGPDASPLSISPSAQPPKKPRIPVAASPRKISWWHALAPIPPMNQGTTSSPPIALPHGPYTRNSRIPAFAPSIKLPSPSYRQGPVASPNIDTSEPPWMTPTINAAAPLSRRSRRHAPVVTPPMSQEPVPSPVILPPEPPMGNSRSPVFAPSIILPPPPPHHQGVKGPVGSAPSISPSGSKSRIPIAAPLSKRSQMHAPVAMAPTTPPPPHHRGMIGPVGSAPSIAPSGSELRIPIAAPPSKRSQTHAPVAMTPTSPPHHRGMNGPVGSAPSIAPPGNKPRIPVAAPPSKRSQKHVPVAMPSMSQGPVGSAPSIAAAGNKPRIPVAAPPSKRLQKHVPVATPSMSQGPVSSPPIAIPPESSSGNSRAPAFAPSIVFSSPPHHQGHVASPPNIAPSEPPGRKTRIPVAAPTMIFPPPPPDHDCTTVCAEPLTYSPPGSPCGCVYPMQVELGLGVALYAFFPLVSELAIEIAAGTYMKQSQVRIMGANADSQDQEKTIVIIDLVPLGEKFDNTTAFLTYERFWQKKVTIKRALFGDYRVIYVSYPGLPASPPPAFSNSTLNGEPSRSSSGPSKVEPLGVNVDNRSDKMGAGIVAVVALSSAIAVVICLGAVWIILLKCRNQSSPSSAVEPTLTSSVTKRSGGGSILSGSMASSASMSYVSSMATYTGSAKTFTSAELEKATDRFNPQSILGEGGFGRVYRGVLEDGTKVAVKVLTRDDQQGGREFIAEVEMLSRLHHRNLVKLIGICNEGHNRCLVYELIPNGSVESHLHGLDKETAPLDWDARMKIALGAARGLAYLHEDSSPRVIHRDFKASNILLEDDFTPKVSDFGLAKAASEEGSEHISTRVMGTFGYVAPEYAMTGHLLVKSDVYSYGVVLLELLSGRKPVDMSQPPGQENLVTWARPLLTSKEGLETLMDPALGGNLPFDNMAKVAAIASMCVQPEVSHRPFMGEVVQALKLVYNDSDASNGGGSGSCSQGGESFAHDNEVKDGNGPTRCYSIQYVPDSTSFVTIDYDSGPLQTQTLEADRPLSASALLSTSGRFIRQLSGSFRRHSSSGPLRTNKGKPSWFRMRGLAGGSISEHGVTRHFGTGLDGDVHDLWP
eukprot:Gb_15406 [translate_table: standard]